jgi:hypothetical protein
MVKVNWIITFFLSIFWAGVAGIICEIKRLPADICLFTAILVFIIVAIGIVMIFGLCYAAAKGNQHGNEER